MCEYLTENVKNYIGEDIEEDLYAESTGDIINGTVDPLTVGLQETIVIPGGYDAIIVGVAVDNIDVHLYIAIDNKQHYPNGLHCHALSAGADLERETPLYVHVKSGQTIKVGFTNTSGGDLPNFWRLRIRRFKTEA